MLERKCDIVARFPPFCSRHSVRFIAFCSLMQADSALPNFRKNMDACPNNRQAPQSFSELNNGTHHKQAVSNLTLYKIALGRICLELFYLLPCDLIGSSSQFLIVSKKHDVLWHVITNRNFSLTNSRTWPYFNVMSDKSNCLLTICLKLS